MLLPELTLESLVTGQNDLVSLLQIHGCGNDDQDIHDVEYIKSLEGLVLPQPPWPPRKMVTLHPQRGATFEIKQLTPAITQLFGTGLVVDEQTWGHVCTRQVNLLTFLAAICDEYNTEWEKSTTAYAVTSSAFADTDATEADRIEARTRSQQCVCGEGGDRDRKREGERASLTETLTKSDKDCDRDRQRQKH